MEKGVDQHRHCCPDFAFGFDDPAFSDRVLKLVISDDLLESDESNITNTKCHKLVYQTRSSQKRRKHNTPESQKNKLVTNDCNGARVKNVNISSLLLAAKSPFFRKLFTNGMKASNQDEVALRIHSSEEDALMEILRFMYYNNFQSANTPDALVQVLVTADKFDVPSCVNYCCKLLMSFSMTDKLALWCIDIPSTVSSIEAIQPLLKVAKDFLPTILNDIPKYRDDIINMSLDGIKIILSRDDLKMDSEDDVFDLFMEWAEKQFPNQEQRQKVYNAELSNLVRLDLMSWEKLKSVGELTDERKTLLPKCRRSYKVVPVSVITLQSPVTQCMVFLDLKKDECQDVVELDSQTFTLGGHIFYLTIQRCHEATKGPTFGLFLVLKASRNQSTCRVRYEFAVRKKYSPQDFATLQEQYWANPTKAGVRNGYRDLFNQSWDVVMAKDSQLFVNGIMHLRVEVTLY